MAMVTHGGQMSFAIFMVPMNIDERASYAPPILPAAHSSNVITSLHPRLGFERSCERLILHSRPGGTGSLELQRRLTREAFPML